MALSPAECFVGSVNPTRAESGWRRWMTGALAIATQTRRRAAIFDNVINGLLLTRTGPGWRRGCRPAFLAIATHRLGRPDARRVRLETRMQTRQARRMTRRQVGKSRRENGRRVPLAG